MVKIGTRNEVFDYNRNLKAYIEVRDLTLFEPVYGIFSGYGELYTLVVEQLNAPLLCKLLGKHRKRRELGGNYRELNSLDREELFSHSIDVREPVFTGNGVEVIVMHHTDRSSDGDSYEKLERIDFF